MDHRTGLPSRFVQAIRELDEGLYLRKEVAEILDVAASTLKVWGEQHPHLAPHGYALIEGKKVYVYTEDDVQELRAFMFEKFPIRANGLRTRRRGRPKIWNAAENADRTQRRQRMRYLRQRAALAAERGEEHHQLDLLAEAELIGTRLAQERAVRYRQVNRPQVHDDWLLRATTDAC